MTAIPTQAEVFDLLAGQPRQHQEDFASYMTDDQQVEFWKQIAARQ